MSRGKKEHAGATWRCYLRDVRRIALLEPDEEKRLICLIEEGRQADEALAQGDLPPHRQRVLEERAERGREARDQVVVANLRLVIRIARSYSRRGDVHGLELSDLIQEGNLGLLMAAKNLESGHGKLSTFVAPWIRHRIRRAMAEQSRIIRIPTRVHAKLGRLHKEERWYLAWKGRPPTPEELAAELGIDVAGLEKLRQAEEDATSLQEPLPDDETGAVYEDLVVDPRGAAFPQRTADRQWLARISTGLPERSRRILERHFGLGLTLDEIGSRENLSRERIRQIEREALDKLRHVADRTLGDRRRV